MTILQAFLISLIYYFANSTLVGVGFFTFSKPLVAGFFTGLILGDPVTGTKIGASINLLYIGNISAGGTMPSDATLAGIIGTTLGITAGLDTEAALAVAVPIGLLGTLLWFGRLTFTTMFVQPAWRIAEAGQAKKMWKINVLLPQAFLFLLSAVPCFIIVYFGTGYISNFIAFLGENVLGILMIIGGLLPALGLALTLKAIYHGQARIYFFLGFFLIQYFGLDMISLGVMSVIITVIYVQNNLSKTKDEVEDYDDEPEFHQHSGLLTKRDLVRSSLIWGFHAQGCYNYERMQGIGFAHAMTPALRKFYDEGSPEMSAALKRHMAFFNTAPQFAAMIPGLIVAMEEQLYMGVEGIDTESITAIKSALMGPLSGIGDTLCQGVIVPLLLSFFLGISIDGNLAGPILYFIIMTVVILGMNHISFFLGYNKGSSAILKLLESGKINKVIDGAKVMGCLVIGGLIAKYVKVTCGIVINTGAATFNLQEQLFDAIIPGLLPLAFTLGCYFIHKKGVSTTKLMLIIVAIGIIGGLTGILI